jgi:exodeoxyribonuclease V alpha subunit
MKFETIDITIEKILHYKTSEYSQAGVSYLIAKCSTSKGEILTIKGEMENAICWESYRVTGKYSNSEKYNSDTIFKFVTHHVISPTTKKGAFKYFSNHIKGIGKVYSSAIINSLGDNAIDLLVEDPNIIFSVEDIRDSVAKEVFQHFVSSSARTAVVTAEITELLDGYSVPKNVIGAIVSNFGGSSLAVIQENPYILMRYPRMGWDKVDTIARKVFGVPNDSHSRVLAAIKESIDRHSDIGHTCCSKAELSMGFFQLTSMRLLDEWIGFAFDDNLIRGDVINNNNMYQLTSHFKAETEIAFNLRRIDSDAFPIDVKLRGEGLEEDQLEAFRTMESHGVAILAGIPGSGKTYTVAKFANELSESYPEMLFMFGAPTGKAAKRLKELLDHHNPNNNFECSTIHKILRWKFSTKEVGVPEQYAKANRGRPRFESAWDSNDNDGYDYEDKEYGLPVAVYIIEESSMCDIFMMASLTNQIPSGSRLIIVGDPYQLQSIRSGAFLRDVLAAGLPAVKLETPRRNAGRIVRACCDVKNGLSPKPSVKFDLAIGENWIHIEETEPEGIHNIILELNKKSSMDKFWDMQVISPQKKIDYIGCDDLNKSLSRLLNPSQSDIMGNVKSSLPFTIGDKIIRTKNAVVNSLVRSSSCDGWGGDVCDDELDERDYEVMFNDTEYKVFPERIVNGDMGIVLGSTFFENKNHVVVELKNPTRLCILPISDPHIELAYAVTVHKFQGSSTKCILVPVHSSFYWNERNKTGLMSRELIYTMLSRAEDKLITIGTLSSLGDAVRRKTIDYRKTRLKDFITRQIS